MKRRISISLWLMVAGLILALTGCGPGPSEVEAANAAVPVKLGRVMQDRVEETYMTIGKVIPKNQLDVYLSGIGEVETIFIHPGDFVEKDMPLLQLANNSTKTTFNATESQLRTIRDNLAVQYNTALESYNLQKSLYDTGTVSEDALQASRDQLLVTQRQYQDAQTTYLNQVSNLRSSVDDLVVKSPIDGQVASLAVKVGENARNQLAATLIDNSTIYVQTMVSGELKNSLSLDQDVRLSLEGIEAVVLGRVKTINEVPDIANKLFEVRIEIMEDVNVNVGDYSEVKFVTQSYETLLVPSTALVRKGIEKYIFTYEDETLKKVILETGLSKGDWIEVKSDEIQETTTIVVRGQNDLREETEIQIIEDK